MRLKSLSERGQKNASRKSMTAGLRVLVVAIKSAAPVGPTGNLRRGVKSRFLRSREGDGKTVAKAGPDVGGKGKRGDKHAPHGHIVTLGTHDRWRRSIGGWFTREGRIKRATLHTVVQKKKRVRSRSNLIGPVMRQTGLHGVGYSTGRARPDGFVARAQSSSAGQVKSAIVERMPAAITEEWNKSK